ncbi:MAG: DNA topoisomerase I, partial [Acidobacteriota bacterium]|nr:DNA topoisomerase I [Acidobacteriota bacterium]
SGRFGPFVKCGSETRSIGAEDDVYEIGLDRALELLAQPKKGRRRAARTVLRELGSDDAGAPVQLLDGNWGPYLSNGTLNASLPNGLDPQSIDLESAVAILAERGKAPRRGRRASKKA